MGAACQSCGGMGVLEDGKDCPECVGGKKVEHAVVPGTVEIVLPEATPSGNVAAAVTDQAAVTPAEAAKVPGTVEIEEGEPLGAPSSRKKVKAEVTEAPGA